MANNIKCPNCGHVFDVENVLAADIEQKFQQQYKSKLNESLQKVEEDKKRLDTEKLQFEEKKRKENGRVNRRRGDRKLRVMSSSKISPKKEPILPPSLIFLVRCLAAFSKELNIAKKNLVK